MVNTGLITLTNLAV